MLQSHNLLDVLNLFVLHDLIMARLAYIKQFTAQWKHTKVVSTNHTQSSHRERLGRVSFCKDQSAVPGIFRPSIVSVGQLG